MKLEMLENGDILIEKEQEFYIKELELDDTKNLEQEIGNYMI